MVKLCKTFNGLNAVAAEIGSIQYVLELKLMLYRHGFVVFAVTDISLVIRVFS